MAVLMRKAERSLSDIIGQLIDQVTSLIKNESALARAEISEKISKILVNLSALLIGAALLLPAIIILLEEAIRALIRAGVAEPLAALAVGGGTLIFGIFCIAMGISRLKAISLVPNKTIQQLHRDLAAVQEVGKNP